MAFDVFISYAQKDKAVADSVCAQLEVAQLKCWMAPRNIEPGAEWAESIVAALGSCKVMALIFSSHSNVSQQVTREVERAFEKGLTVVPFRIENVMPNPSLEYYMGPVHWLDAFDGPLEQHIDRLAAKAAAAIHPDTGAGAAPETPASHKVAAPAQAKWGRRPLMIALAAVVAAGGWWFVAGRHKTPATSPNAPEKTATIAGPTKERPFENSLGMRFVAVHGTKVMFSIWDTRVEDFEKFVDATGHAMGGMFSWTQDRDTKQWSYKQVGATWKNPGFDQTATCPVVGVSWDDATAFCAWLTDKERKEGGISAAQEYRLPANDEWSAAAGTGMYPWGSQWPPPKGAGNYADETYGKKYPGAPAVPGYDDGYAETSPVGTFQANGIGLYDMGGNVWQWCEDFYDSQQTRRVIRGASWNRGESGYLETSYRYGGSAFGRRYANIGFRCVLTSTGETYK